MEKIPIARPLLGQDEAQAAAEAVLSGWVTQGPRVAQFESEFAHYVGASHAVAVSNCTVALHLALKGVGVEPDSEVLVPSHSFIATANSITYLGAVPVFVDIERDSFNLDPDHLEEAITERTSAILLVHQVGMPANLHAVLEIAQRYGLPVVEDAACAVGSEILWGGKWQKIGSPHGRVACFSFHPRKVLTTGDGGMLTTDCPELARSFRLWRQHGMSVPDTVRHGADQVIFEQYLEVGYNYRMTDIQAAVGRVQLKRLDELVRERREQGQRYHRLLGGLEGVSVPTEPEWARTNWQTYLVTLTRPEPTQRQVMQALLDQGISTRRGIMCAHREPAYQKTRWWCGSRGDCDCQVGTCRRLAVSEWAQDHALALPLFPGMTPEQQQRVADALDEALSKE